MSNSHYTDRLSNESASAINTVGALRIVCKQTFSAQMYPVNLVCTLLCKTSTVHSELSCKRNEKQIQEQMGVFFRFFSISVCHFISKKCGSSEFTLNC